MSAPAERLRMSEAWRQWEGEVVDQRFQLLRFLGSSDHSAVFLTEIGQPPQNAALKFVEAASADAQSQLARWERASKLSHPHLIRILHFGSCRLGRASMFYVVSEFAEENLSQILPVRALNSSEAEYMLRSVLEALAYLHGHGLVHGRLRPSNVMAVEEKLKISSDGVSRANEKPTNAVRTIYDPPEATTAGFSPAGDVWSLGVTLVEALTQRPSLGEGIRQGDPLLPETVPAPFLEIARQCLRLDPQRRWTVSDIAARLLPTAPPPKKNFPWRYGVAAAVLALIIGGVIVGQKFLSTGSESRSQQSRVDTPASEAPQGGAPSGSSSHDQHTAPATSRSNDVSSNTNTSRNESSGGNGSGSFGRNRSRQSECITGAKHCAKVRYVFSFRALTSPCPIAECSGCVGSRKSVGARRAASTAEVAQHDQRPCAGHGEG